jgi:hypothetical protein
VFGTGAGCQQQRHQHKLRRSGAIAEGSRVLLLLTATHLIPVGKREVHGL